ncbi:MAG: alkaline phosphatase family protein [Solirubrobacteraceae bacterium]
MTVGGGMTRRQALRSMAVAGVGAAGLSGTIDDLVSRAVAASPKHGKLSDIEHVVILIQENRSFDHYFGMYPGVRGFGDKRCAHAFFQRGQDGHTVKPFHFDTGCMADITHDWGPQHQSWNGGRMNRFLAAHQAADAAINGVSPAAETMGYYDRKDLPFYYALADKFTLCDGYHCSVLGPTDPNRLMSMSAWLDPAGTHGGPLLQTLVGGRAAAQGTFTWRTMPEQLSAKGVSWKVYSDPAGGVLDNVLTYFKAFTAGTKLHDRGVAPTYPADFMSDLAGGKLPKVSWVLLGLSATEHPNFSSPQAGEVGARAVVEALVSQPDVWRKTALFLTWDENGGFFDHVAPPTPPAGTAGEFITAPTLPAAASGIRGPIGLGFRVPMLIVSPFSRGGLVCTDKFDHTSTLRFLETRFGVRVPNLSRWRRRATGDLTRAFNFAARPNASRPALARPGSSTCSAYPPVTASPQPFPKPPKAKRRRPSGIV